MTSLLLGFNLEDMRYVIVLFIIIYSANSFSNECFKRLKNKYPNFSVEILDYAKSFKLYNFYKFKLIEINRFSKESSLEYVLVGRINFSFKECKRFTHIEKTPEAVVPISTTYIAMLESLGLEKKVIGYPGTQFISSPKTRDLIKNNKIKNLKDPLSMEEILSMKADLIFGYTFNVAESIFKNKVGLLKTNYVSIPDYTEPHPLGRAELIKVMGVIFNKYKKSVKIFNTMKEKYLSIKNESQFIKEKKKVLIGTIQDGGWSVPGGKGYWATIINDAGGKYLFSKNNSNKNIIAKYEPVLALKSVIDFWFLNMSWKTKKQILSNNKKYSLLTKIKTIKIYTPTQEKSIKYGHDFWETAMTRPDLLIEEIYKILYKNNINQVNDLRWYRRIN